MKMEIEMTLDEAILHCEEVADCCDNRECANEHRQLAEWLKELKERKASELSSADLQPCNQLATDCISREAAISETMWNMSDSPSITKDDWSAIIEGLKALPSVQPDLSGYSDRLWKAAYERGKAEAQRTGKWILVKGSNGKDYHKCSECLHTQEITGVKNYCAVCGAKMEEEDIPMEYFESGGR